MKQARILVFLVAVAAMLFLAGCGDNQPSPTEIASVTGNETQDNNTQDNQQSPETSQPTDVVAHNLRIVNTTHENTIIHPMALPLEDAAQIGARYIMDIYGISIDNMYVELEYANWEHMTRTLWQGAVSVTNRNTLASRARMNELNDIITQRYDAGEEWEDIMLDMNDLFLENSYVMAQYYFVIDAVTGKRIDIWQILQEHTPTMDESIPLHEYIEQHWGNDWDTAFEYTLPPQQIDELGQIATAYAQRHFYNTTIANMHFENAFVGFIYDGGGFRRDPSAAFIFTDETGREARVVIHVASHAAQSITTMSNDFIPFDAVDMDRERVQREAPRDDD
ncbi:MAG: hypothetical protein FWC92_04620 [Defluviitaleaceae bacterium]|nr:hypothetical protein [Defluviitaleaceae bacterium]